MTTHKKIFLAVVLLQFLSVAGMIGFKYSVVLTGQTVVLQSRPVDPRDYMRGDYVQLRFSITRINSNIFSASGESFQKGDDIYVTLTKQRDAWEPVKASRSLPELEMDEAVIRGKVTEATPSNITVDYGIDSYYFPEGRGREYQNIRLWKVALDRRGNAVLKGPAQDN